jgi:predicted RNase H-like HicB family nuclease
MKKIALIEKGDDGTFGVFTKDGSVIHGSGSTVTEAKADFEDTVQEMREYMDEQDGTPNELTDASFVYRYDMASMFNFLDWLNISKVAKRIGINRTLLSAYKTGHAYISEKQAKRIEQGLHALADELKSVSVSI